MITTLLGDLTSTAQRRRALRAGLAVVAAVLVATGTGVATTEKLDPGNAGPPIEDADADAYDVVVEDATDGVGAYNVTVSLADSSSARITGFDPHETADLANTTISADGSRVVATVALMNTTDTGRVRIGSLTLSGADAESAGTTLTVNALGDEQGDPYDADTRVRVVSSTQESVEDDPTDPSQGDDDTDGSDASDSADSSDDGDEQSGPADTTESELQTTAAAGDGTADDSDAGAATDAADGDAGTATDPVTADDLGTAGSDSVTDADSSPVPVSGMGVVAVLAAIGVLVLVRRWSG
ncbi:hypothetical protein D3D02_09345 [Halobellus sp. Atlit-38R]|uniref:hypothetical protein n=1 Tax=Halobellus sp. Atlit-38R TaxID=2282131 RepID=UPI000EF198CE|nr:hypothetical protein [Halobellus sp. Atlit-38R]RLM89320.1 hypothetical protein D3D02_09345 [Halobellus sp. Atlit-38R]